MTFTIIQEHINKHYIEISQDKYSNSYKVTLAHTYDGELYRTDKENHYPTLTAAKRRYNALKRGLNND